MVAENENYKLEILEYAVNQCIDRLLPKSSEDALSAILYQRNEVVWRIVTDIYSKSGYQLDCLFIKNVLNLRIEALRNKIAEEAKIKAELEAQRLTREIEEERIRQEQETEQARIRSELEAQKLAKIAEQEKIENERKEQEQRKLQEFKQANPNIKINDYKQFDAFVKIKNMIVEILEIQEERITLNAILNVDLGIGKIYSFSWDSCNDNYSDDSDLNGIEFIMTIEETFDIEILDEESERLLSGNISQLVNFVLQKI